MSEDKKKVLIIDDNETFVMYMCILLKRMGFDVIPAGSGADGLRIMGQVSPDLVMLDVNMPGMGGMETLEKIRNDETHGNLPVVMVSVDSSGETAARCSQLGCSHYLTKPISVDDLHCVLQDNIYAPMGWTRRHKRVNHNARVFVTHNGVGRQFYTESVSEGGVYIRSKKPFPVGSEVEVILPVHGGGSLRLNGTVIYIKGVFGDMYRVPPGMAIEYKGLTESESGAITDYITSLIAGDILDSQEEDVIAHAEEDGGGEGPSGPFPS